MRFFVNVVSVLILSCFICVSLTSAADVAKIGVIDFQRVVERSNVGKAAQAQITKIGKQMETELKALGQQIETLKKRIAQAEEVMSEENRAELKREYRIKINDFKEKEKRFKVDFVKLEQQLIKAMRQKLFKIVTDLGKKEGFLLILEKQEAGILYFPTNLDLTDIVIQELDKVTTK